MTAEAIDAVALMRRMARNNAVANHRLAAALARLGPGEFEAPRTSFFPSIAATANHILAVDEYYLDALERRSAGTLGRYEAFDAASTPAELVGRQAEADRRLLRFCDGLTPGRLEEDRPTDRGETGDVIERVADILLHLFQHQVHHRGQIHAMLAGTTVPPPQLDEYFLRFDRDLRREDLRQLGFDEETG
jgi:uncharacterized damage-inducible protein DinB